MNKVFLYGHIKNKILRIMNDAEAVVMITRKKKVKTIGHNMLFVVMETSGHMSLRDISMKKMTSDYTEGA